MKTMGRKATCSLATIAIFATLLGPASDARAEGADLAAKCRETGDHGPCAAAGAPLEASSPESTLELYSASCAKVARAVSGLRYKTQPQSTGK